MDDTAKVFGIFGGHPTRSSDGTRLRIRDGDLVADLKARLSDLAARDNRARGAGWLIDFTAPRTDALTGRSMFDAILTSPVHGTRRLCLALATDWVQIGDDAGVESSVRSEARDVHRAMQQAFGRIALRETSNTASRSRVRVVSL